MRSSDWFMVGVRLIGVWEILAGIGELVYYVEVQQNMSRTTNNFASAYLFHAVIYLILGLGLLITAPGIARLFDWRPLSKRHACPECGYDLRSGHDKCPECGHPVKPQSINPTSE
jgi:hypothetical protein